MSVHGTYSNKGKSLRDKGGKKIVQVMPIVARYTTNTLVKLDR